MVSDPTWATRAACAGIAPDRLFGKGAEQRDARSICFSCPVRMECLIEALETESVFGVWGGLTERERRALVRKYPDVTDWSAPRRPGPPPPPPPPPPAGGDPEVEHRA